MKKIIFVLLVIFFSLVLAEENVNILSKSIFPILEVGEGISSDLSLSYYDWNEIKQEFIGALDFEFKGVFANLLLYSALEKNNWPIFLYILENCQGDVLPFILEIEYYAKTFDCKLLLNSIEKIKEEKIKQEDAIIQKFIRKDSDTIDFILKKANNISRDIIDRAWTVSMRTRNYKTMVFLLKSYYKNDISQKTSEVYYSIFKNNFIISAFFSLKNKDLFTRLNIKDQSDFVYFINFLLNSYSNYLNENFKNQLFIFLGYTENKNFFEKKYFLEEDKKRKLFYFIGLLMQNNTELLEKFFLENKDEDYLNLLFTDPVITPFMRICNAKNIDLNIIKMLVESYGADINKQGFLGATAIVYAIDADNIDIIKYFIIQKAKLNYPFVFEKNQYNSVLSFAKEKNNSEIIKMLISAGAK